MTARDVTLRYAGLAHGVFLLALVLLCKWMGVL